jgi:hypothetical protein
MWPVTAGDGNMEWMPCRMPRAMRPRRVPVLFLTAAPIKSSTYTYVPWPGLSDLLRFAELAGAYTLPSSEGEV